MRHIILTIIGAALFAVPVARADEDKGTLQAIGIGRGIYLDNCARCHGADARGAELAKRHNGQITRAPDLTTIESRDGRFDFSHVAYHIENRECTSDMPCWRQLANGHGSNYAHGQIWKLTKYLNFVQQTAR